MKFDIFGGFDKMSISKNSKSGAASEMAYFYSGRNLICSQWGAPARTPADLLDRFDHCGHFHLRGCKMDKKMFQTELVKVRTFHNLGDKPDYWAGMYE